MAHFAHLEDGVVISVIVISNGDAPDPAPTNSEPLGQAFIVDILGLPGVWMQTSYSKAFRKNYAGIGYTYDPDRDAFIPPKPFESWVLDEDTCLWEPPIPYPDDGQMYRWDETTVSWVPSAE